MSRRYWVALCGLFCAIVLMSQRTLAGPNLSPVPLVTPAPSQALLAAWAHVKSYTGSYSADIEQSSAGGWHEHFAGAVVLAPMCPNCPKFIPDWWGNASTTQSASGKCGSANTAVDTHVQLHVDIASHTYDLAFIPNPGGVQLKGGDPNCTHPFESASPAAQFSIAKAPLPAPAAGICGTETIYRSGPGWSESDTFNWKFAPKTDAHWTIKMYCPSTINGVAPLH